MRVVRVLYSGKRRRYIATHVQSFIETSVHHTLPKGCRSPKSARRSHLRLACLLMHASSIVVTAHIRQNTRAAKRNSATTRRSHFVAISENIAPASAFLGSRPMNLSAGLGSKKAGAGPRSVATMGLFGLGLPELVVIGGVAAVLFGPSKLPELGKSLGKSVKSFQAAANVRSICISLTRGIPRVFSQLASVRIFTPWEDTPF